MRLQQPNKDKKNIYNSVTNQLIINTQQTNQTLQRGRLDVLEIAV